MRHSIEVHSVIEENTCSGKKHIYITPVDSPHGTCVKFALPNVYMPAEHKLLLASVQPGDTVNILLEDNLSDLSIVGLFTDVKYDQEPPQARCRCGSILASDGFDIYCLNEQCGLTLATRLKRLAQRKFFMDAFSNNDPLYVDRPKDLSSVGFGLESADMYPFSLILDPKFWGAHYRNLEEALLDRRPYLGVSTFLIEDDFRAFIEHQWFTSFSSSYEFCRVGMFYDDMRDFITKRDYANTRQNNLIREFIWGLGIESITPRILNDLVSHEIMTEFDSEPVFYYIYTLLNTRVLQNEIGLHPLEVSAIQREIRMRPYEMYDIFSAYTNDTFAVKQLFSNILQRR